ncbi:hypothetical protein FJY90_06485 [Candidatus Gottesmanbacteria bacterium]|nr:hypothetical protein [Candidatus Gottesmanbacteria bacterium]
MEFKKIKPAKNETYEIAFDDKCLVVKSGESQVHISKAMAQWIALHFAHRTNMVIILNCPRCRKPMKRQIDPITKKRSKYIYGCKCNPKLGVSVG